MIAEAVGQLLSRNPAAGQQEQAAGGLIEAMDREKAHRGQTTGYLRKTGRVGHEAGGQGAGIHTGIVVDADARRLLHGYPPASCPHYMKAGRNRERLQGFVSPTDHL
jgi:hypothetical protein